MNKAQKLTPRVQLALVGGGVVLLLLLGYFVLVSSEKSKASSLSKQIDSTNAQILQARTLSHQSRRVQPIKVATLFRLTKAMPDETDMAGILLQLNLVASQAGISFDSIRPGNSAPPPTTTGTTATPTDTTAAPSSGATAAGGTG